MLLLVASSVALLLSSAKAHGRQLRLERELEGHTRVTFGSANPPFVEALWRRDRIAYWTLVPAAALALATLIWTTRGTDAAWLALATLLWAPILGFTTLGLASQHRLLKQMKHRPTDLTWRLQATAGSARWWGIVLMLAGITILLARNVD